MNEAQKLRDKLQHQKYYQKNKVRIRTHQKAYEEDNKEERAAYHKQHNIKNAVVQARQHQLYRSTHVEEITVWEEKNKEKVLLKQYQYRLNHKAERAIYNHQYYLNNIEKIRLYNQLYGLENKEAIAVYTKKYHSENPGVMKAHHERRRARMIGADGSFTAQEFESLCDVYNLACVYCGDDLPLGPDHIIPLAKGGSNNIENILPSCKPCNCSKGTKSFEGFVKLHTAEEIENIQVRIYMADHPEVVEKLQRVLNAEMTENSKNNV